MASEADLLKDEINSHLASLSSVDGIEKGNIFSFPLDQYESLKQSGEYTEVKIVHFTRHGQGYHNLRVIETGYACQCETDAPVGPCPYISEDLVDPKLTAQGEAEAKRVNEMLKNNDHIKIECALFSPLSRAIQTGLISIDLDTFSTIPCITREFLREQFGNHSCDKRRTKTQLMADYPRIDFSHLVEGDELFTSEREDRASLAARCLDSLRFIQSLPYSHVALFSHSSFLCTLFGVILEQPQNSWFATGEMRSVVIAYKK